MKLETYEFPHSSFLSVEKDMDIITASIIKNERLKKLLYYTTSDALDRPKLTREQTRQVLQENIKTIPKIQVDNQELNYVIVSFDNFLPNATNPEFRDNTISFDIVCHFDQWKLQDYQLRPYRIAAELDTMFNNKRLTGIGKLEFSSATQIILTDEFAGINLTYVAIHGEEDKKNMLNPQEQIEYEKIFNDLFNS